jgi:hypothetical protein
MLERVSPRLTGIVAIVSLAAGAVVIMLGFGRVGPVLVFAGLLLTILTAILITTPEVQVAAARATLTSSDISASNQPTPAVSDDPEQSDPPSA